MSEVHKNLIRAKKTLMEHGWYKGSPGYNYADRTDTRVCLGRANTGLFRSDGNWNNVVTSQCSKSAEVLQEIISRRMGKPMRIPRFNDMPATTFEDVIDVLDEAIIATAPKKVPVGVC